MERVKNFRYMVREQGGLEQLSIENVKGSIGYLYIWHSMSNIWIKKDSCFMGEVYGEEEKKIHYVLTEKIAGEVEKSRVMW